MGRYILRFRGQGAIPEDDLRRIQARPGVHIVESTDRMLLLDAEPDQLHALKASLPDWVMSEEETFSAPDPRRSIRGGGENE